MSSAAVNPPQQRSKPSTILGSILRVLVTTLLFTAGGMGVGLFLGIMGTVVYGMIKGGQIDMTNAYRHVAIPVALLIGFIALVGSSILEVRSRTRTSL
jgi:lipopolysaccharide export LptBFGC system permease protein LptF